ncbi:ABC transporter permease [Pyrococcus abyssi]|uniref:ABC-type transport system, permease component n=1 Tax=Pyrococcus abyssi (strain GE5 / Orsay) TaxID=272844 RepID=Q9V1H3_PYRAB|nr:ABC transporter permease [Pyrococcus abyssi]CAB49376.1 Putative ABC-type transport system, permease component [Pyrococcus abyssi GE5]CCE69837.1 TPA: ribose ABC transporter, permease protein [Pyrococcus abyssi GE5]
MLNRETIFEVAISIVVAFLVGAIALLILGYHPVAVYKVLFKYGYSNVNYLLNKSTPLILTGLAFSIPAIAGVFNIGGESQLYVGAFLGLLTAYYTGNAVLAIIVGIISGGLLGLFVGFLRVYRGINEVITAIMVNWIFYYLIAYLIASRFYNPEVSHESVPVPPQARIPGGVIFGIAVAFSILYYYILYFTDIGFKLRVSGLSPVSARYAGFNPSKAILTSMLLGGAAAGLGGVLLVLGITYSIDDTLTAIYGLGFTGIGIGLLGRNHPIGIIFSSIFLSGLLIGGQWVELKTGAPPELADTLIGVIVLALAIPYAYRMLLKRLKEGRE